MLLHFCVCLPSFVDKINIKFLRLDDSPIQTTPLGWMEYFGIYNPTVTTTSYIKTTVTKVDPITEVTFSIRNCKPSGLPTSQCKIDRILPSQVIKDEIVTTKYMPDITTPLTLETTEMDFGEQEVKETASP